MDEKDMQSTLERASLLQDRWYLIFKDGESDDHVSMTAYDTTEEDEDDEYIPAGAVILSGLIELMESDFDVITAAGLARLAHSHVKEALEEVTGKREVTREEGTNVIKVNFGKVQ